MRNLQFMARTIKERIKMSMDGDEKCFTTQGDRLAEVLRRAGRPLHNEDPNERKRIEEDMQLVREALSGRAG